MRYLIILIATLLFSNEILILDKNESAVSLRLKEAKIKSIKFDNNINIKSKQLRSSVVFLIDSSAPMKRAFEKGIKPLLYKISKQIKDEYAIYSFLLMR